MSENTRTYSYTLKLPDGSVHKFSSDSEVHEYIIKLDQETVHETKAWRKGMDGGCYVWEMPEFHDWIRPYIPKEKKWAPDKISVTWEGSFIPGRKSGMWNYYRLSEICIPMVGSVGSGKTSVLVSMWHQLNKDYSFLPDSQADSGKTERKAEAVRQEMARQARTPKGCVVQPELGGTQQREDAHFFCKKNIDHKHIFTQPFRFIDFSGGAYQGTQTDVEPRRILRDAQVSMLTIDAPAMMGSAYLNDVYNTPDRIVNLYKEIMPEWRMGERSVIIVLTKAEIYLQKDPEGKQLKQRLREVYAGLLHQFWEHNVRVYCTAVKTIGGVVFDCFDENDRAVYRSNGEDYNPEGCDIPLKICLKAALVGRESALVRKWNQSSGLGRFFKETICRSKQKEALKAIQSFLSIHELKSFEMARYRLLMTL